jgi:phosphoglucosamine mutase
MKKQYFGTDGIRGRVGKDSITVEFMLKLGWAFGQVLVSNRRSKVLIGRDTRISGMVLQSALQAGLSAAGVDAQLLGVLPTPAVAYLTRSQRADAGIVITASHNPYFDNGVKFFNAEGMKLSDEVESAIERQVNEPMVMAPSESLGAVCEVADAGGRYIEFCKSIFPTQLTLNNLKIVLDCAHGATHQVAPAIFHELGAEVVSLYSQPDGFNINDNCGATNVAVLQQKVVEAGADIGVAFDGDGDRLMLVDHRGERVDGDQILFILSQGISTGLASKQGVVGTLMSNLGLEQALQNAGVEFVRSAVGDRYVLAELVSRGWTLGGESSGHIVNLDHTTTGDGIISALEVLRVMQMSGKSLFDLKQSMAMRPQVMINVPVFKVVDLKAHPKVQDEIEKAKAKLGSAGRILVRPSGTEPCVRVMAEGEDETQIRATVESLAGKVEELLRV